MQIAFFGLEQWEKEYFDKELKGNQLFFFETSLNDTNDNLENIEGLIVSIHSEIKSEILAKFPRLKFIATMSTGYDHVDLLECGKRNIVVSNVPSYGEATVAEHTFSLILTISRRIIESVERVKKGEFSPEGLTGFELRGKTLGVIGVGSIGSHVIKIAKGFGMNVLAYKRTPDLMLERQLGFKFVELDILYKQSDIISLHIPYTKETHHFVNSHSFEIMKDGVVVINTARGSLIDSVALLQSLNSGKVKAAGLDVLEEEPLLLEEKDLLSKQFDKEKIMSLLQDHMLISHPHVLITPHNAFNSTEALNKIIETTLENITAFSSGAPINVVSN